MWWETLISTIAGIKTTIKTTTKSLKQRPPPSDSPTNIQMLQQNSFSLCHGHHGTGGSDGVATGPNRTTQGGGGYHPSFTADKNASALESRGSR